MYADAACQAILDKNFNMSVPWFLMAGYLYECCNESLLSDDFYNRLCVEMNRRWREIDHGHKCLVKRNALITSTASYIDEQYLPTRVVSSARRLMRTVREWYKNKSNEGRAFVLPPPPIRVRTRP